MERDEKLYFENHESLNDRNWSQEEKDYAQEQRLTKKYGSKRKYKLVWDVEEAWLEWEWYADFDRLFELLQRLITTKAKSAARKWSGLRIPAAEFESVFWETAWNLSDKHELNSEFLLYETIELSIKQRTIDIARKFGKNKQNKFELQAVSLDNLSREVPDITVDVSEQVTDRLFVHQLLTDPSILNSDERELLHIRFECPEATLRELADIIGYSKDKVSRVIARCDAKVRQECPSLLHYVSYYSTGKKNRGSRVSNFRTDTVHPEIPGESKTVNPSIESESHVET